jgi:stage II sporulation protein R
MKKFVALLALIVLILCLVAVVVGLGGEKASEEFIRLHIRANSNSQICQQVKYQVRGSVVTSLAGVSGEADDFFAMHNFLKSNLQQIENVAAMRLLQAGVSYTASARLEKEEFPARMYNSVLLASGYYYALIIELGEGVGNNWWCVIYPQLCFVPQHQTDNSDLVYRSLFLRLFQNS